MLRTESSRRCVVAPGGDEIATLPELSLGWYQRKPPTDARETMSKKQQDDWCTRRTALFHSSGDRGSERTASDYADPARAEWIAPDQLTASGLGEFAGRMISIVGLFLRCRSLAAPRRARGTVLHRSSGGTPG